MTTLTQDTFDSTDLERSTFGKPDLVGTFDNPDLKSTFDSSDLKSTFDNSDLECTFYNTRFSAEEINFCVRCTLLWEVFTKFHDP